MHPSIRDRNYLQPDALQNLTNQNYKQFGVSVDPNETLSEDNNEQSLEEVTGLADFPATRCAWLTTAQSIGVSGYFPVPNHTYLEYATWDNDTAHLSSPSSFPTDLNALPDYANPTLGDAVPPSIDHLRFRSSNSGTNPRFNDPTPLSKKARLLPREIIWMMNPGYTFESGIPITRYNYSSMQFGIYRALDVLYNAPPRADKLPVKRKYVLVLTDSFDSMANFDAGSTSNWAFSAGNVLENTFAQPRVTISDENPMKEAASETDAPAVLLSTGTNTNICDKATFAAGQLITAAGQNPFAIDDATSIPPTSSSQGSGGGSSATGTSTGSTAGASNFAAMRKGFTLGILRYGFGGANFASTLPVVTALSPFQKNLLYRDENLSETERNLCTKSAGKPTGWAMRRGRFWAQASTENTWSTTIGPVELSTKKHEGYWTTIAPFVARSIFVPDISG